MRIYVARSHNDLDSAVFHHLVTKGHKELSSRLAESAPELGIEFVDSPDPFVLEANKVSDETCTQILRSDCVLVLAFPSRDRPLAGVGSELGYAQAHARPVAVLFTDPVELVRDFPVFTGTELTAHYVPPPICDDAGTILDASALADFLQEWIIRLTSRKLPQSNSKPDYSHLRYLKTVHVFPNGYGITSLHLTVSVRQPLHNGVFHHFAVKRAGSEAPEPQTLGDLQSAFARAPLSLDHDLFSFRSESERCALQVRPTNDFPPEYPLTLPRGHKEKWLFHVSTEDGTPLQPALYTYEFLYGLKHMFVDNFGSDKTIVSRFPVSILDGSLTIRFHLCGATSIPPRPVLYSGSEEQNAPITSEPAVRRTAMYTEYAFRGVLRTGFESSNNIWAQW